MTWLDEMQPIDSIDKVTDLLYSLTFYHGGMFTVDKKLVMTQFKLKDEDLDTIFHKLLCKGVLIKIVRNVVNLNELGTNYKESLVIRTINK